MTPYYEDPWLTVYGGDCRAVMAEMEPASVHCVVTSPPYWGLRDYGTAGQLGLEPTPEEYVANLVDVFRDVRRVLRSDGTVWLNLGDSYAGSWGAQSRPTGNAPSPKSTLTTNNGRGPKAGDKYSALSAQQIEAAPKRTMTGSTVGMSVKPKDLVGIPWRVAFALQADGWYLRSDIIWSKPNPMPESVTDRPTKSHEYLFLLSKSARYHYDAAAIAEPSTTDRPELLEFGERPDSGYPGHSQPRRRRKSVERGGFAGKTEAMPGRNAFRAITETRNRRTVWTVATSPYPGAHFATFPPKLVEPCVKAGCPVDGVVLDPFGGSGTTGVVAQSLGRRAILIDLNPDYLAQAMGRNRDIPLGLVG